MSKPLSQAYIQRIIREGCERVNAYSQAAEELLLGTCAKESLFGTYRRQISGPARGIFQMEPSTDYWLQDVYSKRFPWIGHHCDDLILDDILAAAMCRLRYRVVPDPLPKVGDLFGQAAYWKQWYNTPSGKGTIQSYIQKYREYVK